MTTILENLVEIKIIRKREYNGMDSFTSSSQQFLELYEFVSLFKLSKYPQKIVFVFIKKVKFFRLFPSSIKTLQERLGVH